MSCGEAHEKNVLFNSVLAVCAILFAKHKLYLLWSLMNSNTISNREYMYIYSFLINYYQLQKAVKMGMLKYLRHSCCMTT